MQTTTTKNNAVTPRQPVATNATNQYDLVVFCHLRWDFVYQRPQHIISRMAKDQKVLLIEEPWFREHEATSRLTAINPNLHILQPNVKSIEDIAAILPNYVGKNVATGWFYSASFVPLLSYFEFDTIIYDCMDELSLFKGAPEKLIEQEQFLMANADVMFTGGKSLYESKMMHHDNVHCFPSSVDYDHFAQAQNGIALPQDIANIKGPIAGYFGVIDERINLDMLNDVALLKPDVSFVMIGPLAKIGEHDLPRQANIHYLGMKDYKELPGYLKAFSVALMPFALNDATKYISPTKSLEYMAAGKPIISTAIKDVVRDYSTCIMIVESADEFATAIDAAFSVAHNAIIEQEYSNILKKTSWNATVEKMRALIKTAARS
ncbi:glycosyltransferase [Flavobacterium subsaxonicum]|uniref:glycosyltransferase n=1 Tax=Flavobacterium subsaxonicum TaxID=426226 RepID=UPI000422B489|nr:glycosyltransferase [Flavobacterium subsaxonicum]